MAFEAVVSLVEVFGLVNYFVVTRMYHEPLYTTRQETTIADQCFDFTIRMMLAEVHKLHLLRVFDSELPRNTGIRLEVSLPVVEFLGDGNLFFEKYGFLCELEPVQSPAEIVEIFES